MILEVGSETINAHKVVLASVSPYFYAMFNGKWDGGEGAISIRTWFDMMRVRIIFPDDMLERNSASITMLGVDPTALRQLIEYTYSGDITITEDNVQVPTYRKYFN